jgi:outer membrane receptor for monomeric catechols
MKWRGGRLASRLTNMTERDILPVTLAQHEIIVDALNTHYAKLVQRTVRHEEKTGSSRTRETIKKLAQIQETLQYITLLYNVKTLKLNEDVARSGGLTLDETEDERQASEKELGRTNRDPKES